MIDDAAKYEIILYWSKEDSAFIGEVPELQGCSAHGFTQSEALAQTQNAIAAWIDVARELEREIPKPKGRRLLYA